MNIREELEINAHQPLTGSKGTDEGTIFEYWIRKYRYQNMYFICSQVYNLGRVQGIRDERARRKTLMK